MLKIDLKGVIYEIDHFDSISEFSAHEQLTGEVVSDPNILADLFATSRRIDYLQKAINPTNGFLFDLRDGAIQEQGALQNIVQQERYVATFETTSSLFFNFVTGSLTGPKFSTEIAKFVFGDGLGTHAAKRSILFSLVDAKFNQAEQGFLEAFNIWPQIQQPDMTISASQVEHATASALAASEQFLLRTNLIVASDITESEGFWSDFLDFWVGVGATLLPNLLKTDWAIASDAFKNITAVADLAEKSLGILSSLEWGSERVVDIAQLIDLLEFVNTPVDNQTLINQEGRDQILAEFNAREQGPTTIGDADTSITLIKTQTSHTQSDPLVIALTDGGFVVIWDSGESIFGQHYNASGVAQSNQFRVNSSNSPANHISTEISATGLIDGGFVVTWNPSGDIFGRHYNASGVARDDEFRVNPPDSLTQPNQSHPSVTSLIDGGFVVTWSSSIFDILGQRYDVDGVPQGDAFEIDNGRSSNTSVTGLADGGFVVTWERPRIVEEDIYGLRYDTSGEALGDKFLVNTYTNDDQVDSSVTALVGGGFVVTWSSFDLFGSDDQDGSGSGIYGQRYDVNGEALGAEFRVNSSTTNSQVNSSATTLTDGGFVVTWWSFSDDLGDGFYGQRYDANGNTLGTEFHIDSNTTSSQLTPSVIGLTNDGLVVTRSFLNGVEEINSSNNDGYQINSDTAIVSEVEGTINFAITRPDDRLNIEEMVYVSTVQTHGSLNVGDYMGLLNESITFNANETTKVITVNILPDSYYEPDDEIFGLIVQTNPTDPVWISLASQTFTIQDMPPPTSDRLFNWAESIFDSLFPNHPVSQEIEGFHARIYENGNALGEQNENIYFYDGNSITLVGTVIDFLPDATSAGF